jgi:NAD(P)-dependent dehydrogenase (short-subunit alcohol dehydrogenase family)
MKKGPFNLEGKRILVTGASGGIGRSVAVECSKAGASLVITGRKVEKLDQTMEQLAGDDHLSFAADLTSKEDQATLLEKLPRLNGIVHCIGAIKTSPFRFLKESDLRSIFDINFFSSVTLSRNLLNDKKIMGGASIIFISSISGTLCSIPGNSAYSATKAALNGIVKGMALELASSGIRVNSIMPGMIDTGILDEGIITKEQISEDIKRYPLGRYGRPEEVAWSAVYLLSDAAGWVTGSGLLIDGGYTLR